MTISKWAVGLIVAVALVGCGAATTSTTSTSSGSADLPTGSITSPLSGTVKMSISNFTTSPSALFVKKGAVIEITNNDVAGHSFTADDGSFDTGVIGKGKSTTVTLNTVGTIKFHCTPHSSTKTLQGTITVVE